MTCKYLKRETQKQLKVASGRPPAKYSWLTCTNPDIHTDIGLDVQKCRQTPHDGPCWKAREKPS